MDRTTTNSDTTAGGLDRPGDGRREGDPRRKRLRDSLLLSGRLTWAADRPAHDVRIRNLSATGAMIEFSRPLPLATVLSLDLRGIGTVFGTVAWCTDGRIGMAFDMPIDPQLARKPVGGGTTTPVYAKPIL